MVTHNWGNNFRDLVSAIVADSLGLQCFGDVVLELTSKRSRAKLLERLRKRNALEHTYWVCAFSINQHTCICSGFGVAPMDRQSSEWQTWDCNRRNSHANTVYPVCDCQEVKYFNDTPDECELNKFDEMIASMQTAQPLLRHVIAVDTECNIFTRAWCIAELAEADCLGIAQFIMMETLHSADRNYDRLTNLRVQDCVASRPQDKEAILAKVHDLEAFNHNMEQMIFGTGGLLHKWKDSQTRLSVAGRLARQSVRQSQTGVETCATLKT